MWLMRVIAFIQSVTETMLAGHFVKQECSNFCEKIIFMARHYLSIANNLITLHNLELIPIASLKIKAANCKN